eukprot:COSAG02_NODE_79_length_40228_cov_18.435762_22_plen_87_part_00
MVEGGVPPAWAGLPAEEEEAWTRAAAAAAAALLAACWFCRGSWRKSLGWGWGERKLRASESCVGPHRGLACLAQASHFLVGCPDFV